MTIREEIENHILDVRTFIEQIRFSLFLRGRDHDESKLQEPEFTLYEKLSENIKAIEDEFGYGSHQYEKYIRDNQDAFYLHFKKNRHHPEYHPNGIDDMNLVDIIELFCDWKAAASKRGKPVNLDANQKRFGVSDQLIRIFENTLRDFGW